MSDLYRYKLTIEYEGSEYSGWQQQKGLPSIQEHIQLAVHRLFKVQTPVYGAGRTDQGVHALGQVAHFDAPKYYEPIKIKAALNSFLKNESIYIRAVELVDATFHARFSAKSRSYIYKIFLSTDREIFRERGHWVVAKALDIDSMKQAGQFFIGKHDFSAFRSAACQAKSAIRSITNLQITQTSQTLEIYIQAPSFLHNQVRIIVGTLYNIGLGKLQPEGIKFLLQQTTRQHTAFTAPAVGLYLFEVTY